MVVFAMWASRVARGFPSILDRVVDIVLNRSPRKVFKPIVEPVVIQVTNNGKIIRVGYECFCKQAMYPLTDAFSVNAKVDTSISVSHEGF